MDAVFDRLSDEHRAAFRPVAVTLKAGASATFTVAPADLRYFDATSGKRIEHGGKADSLAPVVVKVSGRAEQ